MIKILPTFFPPISDCYSACSGVASILQAYDQYNPALFLNRLYFFRKSNNVLKFATLEKTNETTIYTCGNREIVDLLLKSLDNNDYVFINLDHFYIKSSDHFQSNHFLHDVTLIYGYDLDKKIFYCADNFSDGKYLQKQVSFEEVSEAYASAVNEGKDNVIVFHYNDNFYNKKLDFYKIRLVLQDYINSEYANVLKINPTFLTDNIFGMGHGQTCTYETCIFGIKIYNWLFDYLRSAEIDLRPLQLLVNHQNILYALIVCMQRYVNSPCMQKYTDILKEQISDSIIARSLAIKYDISQIEDIHIQMIAMVKQIYNKEQLFFNAFMADTQIWCLE